MLAMAVRNAVAQRPASHYVGGWRRAAPAPDAHAVPRLRRAAHPRALSFGEGANPARRGDPLVGLRPPMGSCYSA